MKKYDFIAAITAIFMLVGCSEGADDPKSPKPEICPVELGELVRPIYDWDVSLSLKDVAEENVGRANGFAADLFRTVFKANGGNACVSPASVFCTFAMMANGDDGGSRDEILEMLGYGKGSAALFDLNVYANALLRETTEFDGPTLCGFTNSIWHKPEVNVYPDFANDVKGIYGAMIFPVWIGDENGMEALNKFVCDQTRGMINPFLEQPLDVGLAFLNTTYFKGAWVTAFVKDLTKERDFHNIDGSKTKTPFMTTLENGFDYGETDGIRCIRMPYKSQRYSMTLLQPLSGKKKAFDSMLDALDSHTIAAYENSMERQSFILRMPKFGAEINKDILTELMEMGIDRTCSLGLSKVADDIMQLGLFQHAVKIIVDEEGTEAGAASLGGMYTTQIGSEYQPKEVTIDSPFIYMIRDIQSGTVLFMGAVTTFK